MIKWRLKACPRCGGDAYMDKDADGWFEQCLQCSFRRELKELKVYQKKAVAAGVSKEDWSKEKDQ
jgi:hypothetical protein